MEVFQNQLVTSEPLMRYSADIMRFSRLVLLLFFVAQVCDGVFTYVAVSAVGIGAEGNALLASWMHAIGPAPTLLVAKLVSIAAGLLVYVRGLHGVLAGLTAFYLAAAVGPWLFVYANWP
jgi:hypothetical protein